MPRQARLDIPGALHHIIMRGINRSAIFVDDEDRAKFVERLGDNITEGKCSIYAWVLMTNHVHLLFRSGERGISIVMRKLLTWYALYFNRRHQRTGHFFENCYKSILCEEDNYLLALLRYIHLNPVRAGITKTLEDLERYPWSGHAAVMGKKQCLWMDTDYVLLQFDSTKRKARNAYRQFVEEGIDMGRRPELTGGGLVRSLGGWSQVQSTRGRGHKAEYDERILGCGDFVAAILSGAEEKQIRQLKIRRTGLTIKDIIGQECEKARISEKELRNGSRRMRASKARESIVLRGVEELGLSFAEIARHMGVCTSTIMRALARAERTT